MQRFRIDVSYDGTAYVGWQIQPNGMTVQQRIQEVIHEFTGEQVIIHGSGRTDQGVHARKQVAHFDLTRAVDTGKIQKALNALLPPDIRVLRAARVSADFHARRSASGKEYRYFIWNAEILPPDRRLFYTHVRNRLDESAMRESAQILVGRHDFASFTANPNRIVDSTVRDLYELKVTRRGSEIVIIARGSGFLYKMVRSLAGYLIKIGDGSEEPVDTEAILTSCKRTARVPTAPPHGLFLWAVQYEQKAASPKNPRNP